MDVFVGYYAPAPSLTPSPLAGCGATSLLWMSLAGCRDDFRNPEQLRSCTLARRGGIPGAMKAHPDRLRDVVDAVIEALDDGLDGRALATRADRSRFRGS